jgi:Uma2 family endonuclease
MEAKKHSQLTLEEYLAIEIASDTKHEYHDGDVYALAGGTVEHALISSNILIELGLALRNNSSHCRAINSEVKLRIDTLNKYLYPDAMVICGAIEKSDNDLQSVANPTVIIEVLSKSTEAYDRGDKFFFYKQISSLQDYIIIDQYQPLIDIYSRKSDLWKISRVEGIDQRIPLLSINIELSLQDIYRDVFKS